MNNLNVNQNGFNDHQILDALQRQMADNGVPCDKQIIFDGKFHRFSKDQKKNQPDEWYIASEWLSPKNYQYITVTYGSWSDGSKFIFRSWDKTARLLDEQERRELHAAYQKRREEAEKLVVEAHDQAAVSAKEVWEKSEINPQDKKCLAYANRKGIQPIGARFGNNPKGYPSMVIPLINNKEEIRSLQFISESDDGTVYKTFLSGGEKKGNFMILGTLEDRKKFIIAEGYSTACSCYEASGAATVVAFDCGNLPHVVRQLRGKYPNSEIIICGDDDSHREDNPGKTAAIQTAIEFGCKVALPCFPQGCGDGQDHKNLTDFNDLVRIVGNEEVKRQIESAEAPLSLLIKDVAITPTDKKIRNHIFTIAYLAVAQGDLSQRDMIISELHKILKSAGIERNTLNKEFKQFVKDHEGQILSLGTLDAKQLSEEEKRVIDELTETYGVPIPFDHNGKAKGINQMFFSKKFARERQILYEFSEHAFHEYHPETGLWKYKTDERVIIELGLAVIHFIRLLGFEELLTVCTQVFLRQLTCLLKGNVEQINPFQRKRGIIHAANGILSLNEDPDILLEFSPEYYSRNRSDIAVDTNADCPRFIQELLEPAITEEDILLLQKYCGQCLLGYNPSQTILLIPGTPGGGKSTLVSVIEKVIGLHNIAQLKVNHLSERFEVASFFGKTLLTGKDVPGNFLDNPRGANVLKSLVGGDRLSAEQKNLKRRFDIVGEFNIIITSNARLHLKLDSDIGAWQRRLLIIEFEKMPPKKPIPHFDDLLVRTEGSGILNWMIEGAIILLNELETFGRIQRSKVQMQRVDDLLAESDSVVAFAQNCVVVRSDEDVTVAELSEAYTQFCQDRDWKQETVSSFETQIKNVMLQLHRASRRNDIIRNTKSQRGFKHVALVDVGGY
jgi:putative DNA primase/helicase